MGLKPITSDPTGEVYGFPTYRWGDAPAHLMTRRQLSAKGLRKNGQDPVAVMRHYAGGWQVAYLYDSTKAADKRPWTEAKQAAVQTAADSKKFCRACGELLGYVPRQYTCEPCHDDPTRWRTTMQTRLLIDYAGGTVELISTHANALRDILRLMKRIEQAEDRTVVLFDRDGGRHHVNLSKVDRVDFTWEPSADAVAPATPQTEPVPIAA
jgi:hypothetical protein